MKIIAHTGNGYLVDMTEEEVARAAGFAHQYDPPWKKDGYGRTLFEGKAMIGTSIVFVEPTDRLRAITAQEEKVRQNAALLRGLADMLEQLTPSKIIAPEPPAAEGDANG